MQKEEDDLTSKKSQKLISKVSLAKKILRKKIKVNTKVVFDEEGEVSYVQFISNEKLETVSR